MASNSICFLSAPSGTPPWVTASAAAAGAAELVAALRENAAYCEEVHRRLDGAAGAEVVDFFGKPYARASLLFFNTSHAWEHYGNLVTYMRLKDVLPPSSEPKKKESK
jgi:hypothetical protein